MAENDIVEGTDAKRRKLAEHQSLVFKKLKIQSCLSYYPCRDNEGWRRSEHKGYPIFRENTCPKGLLLVIVF